jgi:hypothetical protein
MNSILHIPSAVTVVPTVHKAGEDPVPNQFSLEVRYKPNMPAQRFHNVHACHSAAIALRAPSLKWFHLATLKIGSPEQAALPSRPSHVVLAVELDSGESLTAVPDEWLRLRRRGLWTGFASVAVSLALLVCNFGVMANVLTACVLVMGAFNIARARGIHVKPFSVNESWGFGNFKGMVASVSNLPMLLHREG